MKSLWTRWNEYLSRKIKVGSEWMVDDDGMISSVRVVEVSDGFIKYQPVRERGTWIHAMEASNFLSIYDPPTTKS